jgi:hypothetical protein
MWTRSSTITTRDRFMDDDSTVSSKVGERETSGWNSMLMNGISHRSRSHSPIRELRRHESRTTPGGRKKINFNSPFQVNLFQKKESNLTRENEPV